MRVNRGLYGAAPESKGGGNGRSLRKPANQRHHPARFPHAKIRKRPHRESSPVPLGGRRVVRQLYHRGATLCWKRAAIGLEAGVQTTPKVVKGTGEDMLRDCIDSCDDAGLEFLECVRSAPQEGITIWRTGWHRLVCFAADDSIRLEHRAIVARAVCVVAPSCWKTHPVWRCKFPLNFATTCKTPRSDLKPRDLFCLSRAGIPRQRGVSQCLHFNTMTDGVTRYGLLGREDLPVQAGPPLDPLSRALCRGRGGGEVRRLGRAGKGGLKPYFTLQLLYCGRNRRNWQPYGTDPLQQRLDVAITNIIAHIVPTNYVPVHSLHHAWCPVDLLRSDHNSCQQIFLCLYRSPWLHYSPPTSANRARFPVGSPPDFRKWDSCRTMPLVGGFSRGSPVPPPTPRRFIPELLHTHLSSQSSALQGLAVKSRPNLFTLSLRHEPSSQLTNYFVFKGAAVAERLARSPPAKANRVQYPAGSPDFRKWESWRTMPLVGGFSRGSPAPPPLHSGAAPYPLQSPSSALKTSLLRAAQVSSLTRSLCFQRCCASV
ncbi:hypothetical protein PR048_032658 [Dryococelus australis]|uniref:Uncharacterized protein n=1 Tax=Dryococelus australis TaxID=614101 RepID=A0ABQ9G2U7_9NEOP|nr:hypothetical protein PR048_032658 [Dryococelus australis]